MPSPSPLTAQTDLVSFTIKANGKAIDERYDVIAITTELALNRIPTARILVRDGSPSEGFSAATGRDWAPGVKIEILLGYQGTDTSVFSGIAVKSAVSQTREGQATFTVTCHDAASALTIGRRSALHTNTTDSDLMTRLITGYGLTAHVVRTTTPLGRFTQFSATDWDFLLARAEANGLVVNVAAGTVSVQPPVLASSPRLSLTYGQDILDFSLEENADTQLASVASSAWDPATQAVLRSNAASKNQNPLGADTPSTLAQVNNAQPFTLNTTSPLSAAELTTWADAQLLKSGLAKIRGTLSFQGSALAVPDGLITLSGLGSRFDGNAYVSGVTHEVSEGQWTTTATIGLDPAWFASRPDVSAPLASALLPGVSGLQIGIVKQIDQDPDNQFRVLVNLPVIDPAGSGLWARLAQPYATLNAGAAFYPEIGDEVVLAFLDGDPRFPIIVGSLFSSSRPPPFVPDDKNRNKAIVTHGQLKVLFDDQTKTLTLLTPANNTLVLSDDAKSITLADQNGNSVKLGSDGINLTSVGNIVIKAAQNITVEAQGGNLTAKAVQGVALSGLTVSLAADTALTATGNASASLKSSGETTIQGSLVMIN